MPVSKTHLQDFLCANPIITGTAGSAHRFISPTTGLIFVSIVGEINFQPPNPMRKTFLLIIFFSFSYCAFAQFQIGIFGGASNYQGDLIDKFYKHTKPAIGLTASYELKERLVLRAGLTFAKLAGADSTSDKDYLRLRNLSFETKLTEFSLVAQ